MVRLSFKKALIDKNKAIALKFNTPTKRKKLYKAIQSNKINIGACNINLKNDLKLQRLFQLDKNIKLEEKSSEVAKKCLDAECNDKAIIKINPIFIRDNATPSGKNTKDGKLYNPSTVEISIIKLLTDKVVLKDYTPNITIYYTSFLCKESTHLFRTTRHLDLLLKKNRVEPDINVLVAEFVDGEDFNTFIKNTVKPTKEFSKILKSLIFQVIITLAILQDLFQFCHFDLHGGNVLVDFAQKPGGYWKYKTFNKEYYIPNLGFQSKIWDFDFSTTFKKDIIQNSKVFTGKFAGFGVTPTFNPYYDIFFFFQAIYGNRYKNIPKETKDFITSVVPRELLEIYVPGKVRNGRLVKPLPDELLTPKELLSHPYFEEYTKKQKNIIKPVYKYK